MNSIKASFISLKETLFGKQLPIRQRFFNIIFIFAFIAGVSGALACMSLKSSPQAINISWAMTLIFPCLGLWGAFAKKNQEAILQIALGVVNFIIFPALYLTGGAIDCGIPSYFVMGLALTLFLTKTNFGIFLAFAEALFYLFIYYISYNYPEYVTSLPAWEMENGARDFTYNAIPSNAFMVTTILGFLTRIMFTMYKNEDALVNESIAEIKRQATIDPLTNVFNRRYMYTYLTEQVETAKFAHTDLSIALFDIDNFKLLNDEYGHLLGDEVLKNLARILKKSCRNGEIVARYGGEEFILILPGLDNKAAYNRANEIRECIEQSYLSPELPKDKPITISGGVATYSDGYDEEKLVNTADKNLYEAKENGKNRIVTH